MRTYGSDRLASVHEYLTHQARHLALETADGSSVQDTLERMAAPPNDNRSAAFTQLAISLADGEHAGPDELFGAGRDVLDAMNLTERPWLAVMHGPPIDERTHLHIVVPLRDQSTGEMAPLARLPRDAREAARAVAPLYGWRVPADGHAARRREPRAARSLGVWHGERSLHAWVAEIVAPAVAPIIERAESPAEIIAALAERGLRYAFNARGAVLEDHSSEPVRRVAATALGYIASGPAIAKRFGREWVSPAPLDAKTNPLAYANDREGRILPIATDAERRAFAAEHATWEAVWKPVRDERLAEQRAREEERRRAREEVIARMKAARDETAETSAERELANAVIAQVSDEQNRRDVALARTEREALRALPFAQRPPSRIREWLEKRTVKDQDPRMLAAPLAHSPTAPAASVEDLRIVPGVVEGTNEWWRGPRRIAIDAGNEIVVADPAALEIAMREANRRWGHLLIGGDPSFRDLAEQRGRAAGVSYGFRVPSVPAVADPLLIAEPQGAVRTAAAIGRHLRLRSLELDGVPLDPTAPDVHPATARTADDRAGIIRLDETAIALLVDDRALGILARHDLHPALVAGDVAVFAVDPTASLDERDRLRSILTETFGLAATTTLDVGTTIRYLDPSPSAGLGRLLTGMRPAAPSVTFEQRVDAVNRFIRGLMPRADDPPMRQVEPEEPIPTQTRKRGGRKR
jgi:hypothetical protein